MASFTIAQVALKAADIGLETSDGLLKWTGVEKVNHDVLVLLRLFIILVLQMDPILMGLRKVRSEATSLRKEGVNLNGTERVIIVQMHVIGLLASIYLNGATLRRRSLKKRLFLVRCWRSSVWGPTTTRSKGEVKASPEMDGEAVTAATLPAKALSVPVL